MSTAAERLSSEAISFRTAARENTGAHFLDSGGAYGRHHESPEIPEDTPVVRLEYDSRWGLEASIETASFLEAWLEINRRMQQQFEEFAELHSDLSWFEAGAEFMESKGFKRRARDNVYNYDNDLSQVYVWEVWTPPGIEDWIYAAERAVAVVYLHTGCDVRGGYGRPLFCRSRDSEYPLPMENVVAYMALEARREGREIDVRREDIGREWNEHYDHWPTGRLNDRIKRIFGWTVNPEKGTFVVELDTGEIVRVLAYAPGPNGEILS